MTHIGATIAFSEEIEVREELLEELDRRIREGPVDVRDALASWKPEADPDQHLVIADTSSTLRVVAPAGSGKTQTLINRVMYRIARGENPAKILLLTFDNSAVRSLRTTLERQIGALDTDQRVRLEAVLRDVRVYTLNAFGYWVLRQYAPEEHKAVAEPWQQQRLFRETRRQLSEVPGGAQREAAFSPNLRNRFYLDLFSFFKNETFDPRQPEHQAITDLLLTRPGFEVLFTDPRNPTLVKAVIQGVLWMFQKYEQNLQDLGRLDFDDQKLRPYVLMRERPGLEQTLQRLFAEIIVDEFQDINRLDFSLIKTLALHSTLVVTGDDDQAIYGFRGCSPEYIINLERHLGRPHESHELRTNYRCPRNVVSHADRLIRHNTWRIPKTPLAYHMYDSDIKVVSAHTADTEARAVVAFIRRVKKVGQQLSFADFAVLYRTNAQSLPLQLQFILGAIPYVVRKEDNILHNEELIKLLAALRLKRDINAGHSPSAKDAALTVQGYFRWLSDTDADRLEELFARGQFLSTLMHESFYRILPKARGSKLSDGIDALLSARSLAAALDVLATRFRGMRKMIGGLDDVLDQGMPLGEVFDIAAGFRGDLTDFVQTLEKALDTARLSNAGANESDGVSLLTYFRAKGRQWHTVILTTCNEGLIPHRRAPLEDERRLFYVAITRCTSNLLISYLRKVCGNQVGPSRFLGEGGFV